MTPTDSSNSFTRLILTTWHRLKSGQYCVMSNKFSKCRSRSLCYYVLTFLQLLSLALVLPTSWSVGNPISIGKHLLVGSQTDWFTSYCGDSFPIAHCCHMLPTSVGNAISIGNINWPVHILTDSLPAVVIHITHPSITCYLRVCQVGAWHTCQLRRHIINQLYTAYREISVALFPDLLHLQFLIACCAWEILSCDPRHRWRHGF